MSSMNWAFLHKLNLDGLKQVVLTILTIVMGIFLVVGWIQWREAQTPPTILSVFSYESIFFSTINRVTAAANFSELRKTHIKENDIEVRIWRGFGLTPLEGVFLKHENNKWSGIYVKEVDNGDSKPISAEAVALSRPYSGWSNFWSSLLDKGITLLPLSPEADCDKDCCDGIGYVVEINQNQTYRNYCYLMTPTTCRENKQMAEIGDLIGREFVLPDQQCKAVEWFACAKNSQISDQTAPKQSKP